MSPETPSKTEAAIQSHWLFNLWKMAPLGMMWAIGAPLIAGGVLVFQAWVLAKTLDQAIRLSVAPTQLWEQMLLIGLLIALRASIVWSGEMAASRASEQIKQQLRQQFFAQLLARGPAWSKQTPAGALTTAILDQVQALDGYLQRFLPATISAVFLPLAFAIVILPIDWIVTLLFLISAPLIPLFMALIGIRAEAANQKHQQVLSRLSGVFADRIRGLFTLALMGRTQDEVNAVHSASKSLSATTMKVLRIAFLSSAVLELFAALGVAGVAIYIGLSYLGMLGAHFSGNTLHQGLFCLLLAPEVYIPLRQMAASYHDRATAKAAAQGLHQLYEQLPSHHDTTLPAITQSPLIQRQARNTSGLVLQARQFALQTPQGRDILLPANFTLQVNQPVALMGESGIGKTSLLETLAGLRPYASGQLVHYFAENEYVLIGQQPFINLGSIRQFLLAVNPQATEQQLWSALEQAQAASFVAGLAQGLDTVLGTRGHGVSGGQAHRLALARLFLTDPALIMLDEPTAYLDGQTRDAVIHAILRFARGRALLVATHDEEMAQRIGQVWHIQDQKIITKEKA
ncbi:thiol reductant ABC exporter subunit CydD [Advenella sp. WQ 585]|uniref:Thiol reductant ABC exporter subunit CydD n=1 Tax=Advenella mandrilli TaxID=2800330 RepID=A0ABS1EFG0_9BURK|nr:thiol reductant ABC exporter subunit CydD [Advenella mandrilli]MBK1781380.1 thiol reductant ABC exporter subunit CydD [Advenella mandrilli]